MRKIFNFLLLFLVLSPSTALAKVNVEISNNLDGSNNQVNINSNTSGGNTGSSGNVDNQTHIVINNNGEKKEYHGSDGNIKLESGNGKSSVSVNTTGATNNSVKSTSNINSKTNITVNSNTETSPSSSPEASVAGEFKEPEEKPETKSGIFEFIKKELNELLALFK